MKKLLFFFVGLILFSSCNKDLVEKPENLIDKKVMTDIMYDMALLDALKYQDPNSLIANGVNPKTYVYKKHKIDSLQFVKSNAYYAADYREYKKMVEVLNDRLKKEKVIVDLLINKEQKKTANSVKKTKKEIELKVKKDSVLKTKGK